MKKWLVIGLFALGVVVVVLAATFVSNNPSTGFTSLFGGQF